MFLTAVPASTFRHGSPTLSAAYGHFEVEDDGRMGGGRKSPALAHTLVIGAGEQGTPSSSTS
ncbi:hypothetical protein [Mesorhizobium amorphae]|uniref:hypothetical protein n=1 Tax=Mesorhizobium amorphae TaxID=71433 RepID=UPI0011851917|nr:hypothetical protein [Mesorhizobium amorphae]